MHDERAGGEAGPLEEVLRLAVTGQRERVDADAPGRVRPVDEVGRERLADPDRTRLGLDVEVADDGERARRRARVSNSSVP